MTKLKLNNSDNIESVMVTICPIKNPIAFENRVNSLVSSGLSLEEAKEEASKPLEMEMYFDINNGLFMVEAEAVGNTDIFNPYTKELLEESE